MAKITWNAYQCETLPSNFPSHRRVKASNFIPCAATWGLMPSWTTTVYGTSRIISIIMQKWLPKACASHYLRPEVVTSVDLIREGGQLLHNVPYTARQNQVRCTVYLLDRTVASILLTSLGLSWATVRYGTEYRPQNISLLIPSSST